MTVIKDQGNTKVFTKIIDGKHVSGKCYKPLDYCSFNIASPYKTYDKGTDPARIWTFTDELPELSASDDTLIWIDPVHNALLVHIHASYTSTALNKDFPETGDCRLVSYAYEKVDASDPVVYRPACVVQDIDLYQHAYGSLNYFTEITAGERNIPLKPVIVPTCGFKFMWVNFLGIKNTDDAFMAQITQIRLYVQPTFVDYFNPYSPAFS